MTYRERRNGASWAWTNSPRYGSSKRSLDISWGNSQRVQWFQRYEFSNLSNERKRKEKNRLYFYRDEDPDPVIFSTDPDPTCNNGFIKLFLSWTKYKSESTNSSIKWWFIISNFMPTYLKYEYIFSSFRFKVGSGFFFQLSRIRIHGKKCWILIHAFGP